MPDYFDKALKRARIESQIDDIISEAKDAFPYTPPRPYTNTNDLGTLAGAAGIGAANMVNDTVFGGGGLVLGDIGRGVEYMSPLSGRDENMVHELTNAGFTEEEINQLVPYIDSWVTSLAKKSLDTHNYFSGHLTDWRNQLLGDNPTFAARVAEGAGSSLGFMGLGYLGAGLAAAPGWAGLIGAGISGGLESLSEAGGFLGDAYANGMYDKGLGVANQSLLANAGLNIGLDLLTGPFSPYTRGTLNPYKRFIYGTLGEVANELLQEPSQQVIEQAATNSLNKNSDFFSLSNFKNNELVNSFLGRNEYQGQGWTDMFNQLAPEVALSTLLTQALIGASGILTPSGRQNIKDQHDASQNLSKMGINTVQQGEKYLDNLVKQLPQLQQEFANLTAPNADPNIDNSARIQELTNSISQAYDFLNNFAVFSPASIREKLNGIQTPHIFNADYLDYMKAMRDVYQDRLNSLYQSMTGNMDTDIENLNKAQSLQALINNLDNSINNFWRNPEANLNAFEGTRDDYNAEQINQSKQYAPTFDSPTKETIANNYPEGMFVRINDENTQNNTNDTAANIVDDDNRNFNYEDDTEIRDLSSKIYQGIKGFNINNEQAEFVSHIIATGARHFASYAGMSVDDYLQARGFKIVYDTTDGGVKGNIEYVSNPTDEQGNILREADNIIKIYSISDVSSFIHENGHFFLNDFRDLFRAGKLKGQGLKDWVTLVNWLGVADLDFSKNFNKDSLEGSRWLDAHEKFAVAFERYLREGVAPNSKLKRAFETIKRWMHDIYKSILNMVYTDSNGKARHFNLSPEIRQVMSNIFTDFNGTNNTNSVNDNNADTLSMFDDNEDNAAPTQQPAAPEAHGEIQDDTRVPYEDESTRESELYAIKNSSQLQLKDPNLNQEEREALQKNIHDVSKELRKINKGIRQRIIDNFNGVEQQGDNAPLLTFAPEQGQEQAADFNDETALPYEAETENDTDTARLAELLDVVNAAKQQLQNPELDAQARRTAIYTLMNAARELIINPNSLDKQTRREVTRTLSDVTKELRKINKAERHNVRKNFNDVEQQTPSSIPSLDEITEGYTPEQATRQEIMPDEEPDSFLDDLTGKSKQRAIPNLTPGAATQDTQETTQPKPKKEKKENKRKSKKQSEDGDITREEYSDVASSLANFLAARENSESYNQSAPVINDGERLAGRFIFSTQAKSHSLNVIAQSDNRSGRLSRQRGRALELRNNRGDVFAAYYPYSDSFVFNYTGTNHSQAWKDAFENNFRINLPEYLSNGGFTDAQGMLKSDGNESFRARWSKRNSEDPDAFFDDDIQPEDYEAPKKIDTMTVTHAGKQRTFSVYTGEYSSNDEERQKFFGRYLEVRDENGRILARYSPLAKKYEPYRRTPGAEELKAPILKQLQAHGREYLSKGNFLDENGQVKSDNSEEFRTTYRNRKLNIGKTAKARTIRGTEIKIRYRVVEANDLNVSNQENGAINPEYPQELQPRQRDREASQQQIALMAANLDPELLAENRLVSDGAPVIGSDLVVESGNGRVLAIRRAYKTGAADEYKTWIADNAERFGLSSDEVAKVKQPVLVRERISDVDRVNFTSEANEASTARMSETETALNDAKKINQSMLTLFDPEKPIQSNRAFIQQFVSKVLQQNERGDFFQKNGEISKAGINRIENALIAKAYNNSTILNKLNEVYDDDIKNITNALLAAAPKIAVLENGAFRKDLSIRDDVVQAINALVEIKGEKGSVADYLSQIRIFDDDISNEAKTLLRFFDKNKRSSKKIAQGLINYAEDAMTESKDNQGALPGMEDSNRSKKDILRKAIKDAENGVNTKGESYNQSASSYHETDDDTKRKTLSHIRRTNDAFVTQEQVEKYYQDGNTWHGTGNIILGNVFKMQYIGSNEGSTYRGWGIYSGEAKGTGEAYRKYGEKGRGRSPFTFEMYVPDSPNVKLTTRADFEKYGLNPDIAEYIQEAAEVLFEDTEFSDSILETNKKILNTLVEYFNDEISILENEISGADTIEMSDEDISTREEGIKSYEDVIDFLTSPNIERISFKQTNGNLYRIKVHHVEAYLDYDNKLNEAGQPKIVLDAVKKIIDNLKKRGINTTELEQAKTGGDFYWVLTKAMEWFVDKGKIKSQKHGKITRADMAASLMLNHHGVPGLKFWDALSREKKSGTHNFVTWNEDAITVEGISEDSNEDAIDYFTQMQEKLANAPTKNIDISDDSDLAADSLIERYNQLAYHGTGHTLLGNMFDFDKLGSGEGNQAFGWGAYFAKKLAVAESYRRYGLPAKRWHSDFKITTKDGSVISVRDNQTSVEVVDGGNIDKGVQEYLESIPNIASHLDDASTENIIKELEGYYAQYPEKIERIQSELDEYREKGDLWHIRENERSLDHAKKNYDALRKTIDIIADIKVPRKVSREGNIYEFDIPENKVLLDYDKDIDTQPAHVRKAIRKIREAFINMGIDTGRIDRAQTGQEFYDAVENSLAEYTRKNDIQDSINRSDKRASLFLNKFGIPGLRYLDDGSRNKGKGTSNYVIWDADSLKLMGLTEDSGQDAKDYYERTKAEHEQENSGESYNQIIGETGSGRLDNFEGNAQRRANLDLAKHMERNGNSASEIWAMTGWMRGAEGKWRYEIPDGKFNKQGLLKLARISRELFALDDKTIKDPNYVFTSAEQKEHDRLVDLFSNATLGDVYNAPELFKAYPDIAGIHVIIDEFKGADKNSIAFYNHNDNYIAFNVKYLGKDSDEIRAVLIHEIQHAIQIREGFAGGGNPDEMLSIAENGKIDINPFLRRNYAREERAMYEALPKELREKFRKLREIEKTASKKEFLDNLFKTLSQNETIRYSKWRNLQELVRSITSNKKLITSDEAYWALAGEVEARNAEERSYMNKRERRNTPLDKTEDERYPRERQIVVDSFGNPYSREGSESYNQSLNLPFSPDELTTESGRPIDEAGLSEMLLTPDGSRTLGNIDSKTARIAGILPGTIQANVGVLRHAERQHGKQIINAGYSDVKTFMLHVLNNWSEIREGSNNSLWLVMPKDEGHAGVSAIQLHQDEENVYRVSTLLFARNRSLKNRRLLFAGRPSPAASSGSDMNLTRAPYDFSGRNTAKGVLSEKQSPEESLNSNVLDVNNNGFITPDKLERYNQDSLHGTGHIILDNQHQLKYSGSGEGSAAYGYGIYSTQNRAIAEHYRRYGLTSSTHTNERSESNRGNIYKLDVPEDNEILNWDAKLSEQPEQIMPAIREAVDMLNNHPEKGIAAIFAPRLKRGKTASLERIIKSLTAKFKGHYIGFYEQRDLPEFEAIRKLFYAKDKNAVDDLLDVINKIVFAKKFDEKTATGEKLYWALTDLLGSDINASMYLNSLGIPGHRYLGGMSKAKGESTYNYVTWNEDRVKVLGLTEDSDDDAKEYFRRTKEKLEQANPDMITPENLGENNELVSDAIIERYNQAMLHGTGHIMLGNRFDLSKIGTGETHQAFGWGAYLAQAMGVAETYRKYGTKLASPEFNINVKTKDGKTYSLSSRSRHSTTYAWRGKPDNYLKRVLERLGDEIRVSHNISLDEAKSRVAKEINAELERWRSNFYINVDKDTIQDNIEDNEKCLEALETINSFDVEEKEGRYGNIYRFDGPENDVLLDYDETLDNQPEHVKKAIEKIRRFVKWCGQNKYISINFILRGEFFEE